MRRVDLLLIVLAGLTGLLALGLAGVAIARWQSPSELPTLDTRVVLTVTPIPTVPISTRTVATPTSEPTPQAVVTQLTPRIDRALAGVVQVRTRTTLGTGFVWIRQSGRTLIVTAAHVVDGELPLHIIAPDGTAHPAQILRRDSLRDIALLEAPALAGIEPLMHGRSRTLPLGANLTVVGFSLGDRLLGDPTVTRGILSGRRTFDGIEYLQTDAALNPGASGGPLLDEQGAVVGMVVGAIPWAGKVPAQALNFALAIEEIEQVLGREHSS
ncbi:MAG: serine protease [Thermomicrobium sp.]|nr:serine protease [Thermomicrobium sp.]MDW8007787.1 serine protease [Thermomicrobium sp.]